MNAEAIAALNAAADAYHGKSAEIDVKLDAALDALPDFDKAFYVAPDGDDDNDGLTSDTAFATIRKAVAACPNGGTLEVLLEGPHEYNLEGYSGMISVGARAIRFGTSGTNGRATIKPNVEVAGGSSLARGLSIGYQGALVLFDNVILDTGDLADGVTDSYFSWGGIVSRGAPGSSAPIDLAFLDTEVRLRGHQLWSSNAHVNIYTSGLTIVQLGAYEKLNSSNTMTLAATFRSVTVPAGKTITDFIDMIARDVDGKPINVISNYTL